MSDADDSPGWVASCRSTLEKPMSQRSASPARLTSPAGSSFRPTVPLVFRIVLVRARFILLLLGLLLLVGNWGVLRNHWDRLTGSGGRTDTPVSWDTEYWCPMCPGVLSDWPGKCPVCNMSLVRRQKGEMVPLPDGVVARMQLSPYRIQLAGIQTVPVEYRPLVQEVVTAGFVQPAEDAELASQRRRVDTEISERASADLQPGQRMEVASEAFPGVSWRARVVALEPRITAGIRGRVVRLDVEDPRHELRPGMLVTARARTPVTGQAWFLDSWLQDWQERTTADLLVHALGGPLFSPPESGLQALVWTGALFAALNQGLVLAVPESAVVDTGAKRVVYVQREPGMFDGVEVVLGRRSGDYFPVLRGLEANQRVVATGAFLLDAEGRLNPSIAAGYFGARRGPERQAAPEPAPEPAGSVSPLNDQDLIARQKVCPVTDEPLGSMGTPVRVVVEGQTVFVCCKACVADLKRNSKKYLAKLKQP